MSWKRNLDAWRVSPTGVPTVNRHNGCPGPLRKGVDLHPNFVRTGPLNRHPAPPVDLHADDVYRATGQRVYANEFVARLIGSHGGQNGGETWRSGVTRNVARCSNAGKGSFHAVVAVIAKVNG